MKKLEIEIKAFSFFPIDCFPYIQGIIWQSTEEILREQWTGRLVVLFWADTLKWIMCEIYLVSMSSFSSRKTNSSPEILTLVVNWKEKYLWSSNSPQATGWSLAYCLVPPSDYWCLMFECFIEKLIDYTRNSIW